MAALAQFRRSGDVGDWSAYPSIAVELVRCSKPTECAIGGSGAVGLIALIGAHAYICCTGNFPGGIPKKMTRRPTLGLSVDQLWKMAVYTVTPLSDVFSGGP